MTSIVPSRPLLRHLSRIYSTRSFTSNPIPQTRSHVPSKKPLLTAKPTRPSTTHLQNRSATTNTAAATTPPPESPSTLNTPDITNHYTLFPKTLPAGPPPTGPFDISIPDLRREFLHLQSTHHPDKSPAGTTGHKQKLALSALLNTAYRTLSDPLQRAQYLLHLRYGVDVASEDNSAHATDQATLMEVMEAQEAIEEAGHDEGRIETLKRENQARIQRTTEAVARAFEADDPHSAVQECVRLRYWTSLQDGLETWEPGKEVRLIH